LRRKTHQTIARVTADFEKLDLNTNVAALMELSNALSDFKPADRSKETRFTSPAMASDADLFAIREALEALVRMLAPFSPHISEEMWEKLGHPGGLLKSARWPQADPELARRDELEIPVQVNGKLRSRLLVSPEVTEDELRTSALNDEKIHALIQGHQVVKVIVVPQRLVNVVVK
jgi:leucyl-tRNA synthetase